jgi:adenosylcobinamide kinase/adenosylcobinamide-phosphate guanylyltransferase
LSKKFILITGGARSGKSSFAQELASKLGGTVLFVATATAGDEEMKQRIEEHRRRRSPAWHTLEATTHIGAQIRQRIGGARVVIVDCITLLVNNLFSEYGRRANEQIDTALLEKEVTAEISELMECINQVDASFVIVTNEIGLGLVPADKVSRLYRDLLGRANQVLAGRADEVYLMLAGLPVSVKSAQLL